MNQQTKRYILNLALAYAALALVMALSLLAGCAGQQKTAQPAEKTREDGKIAISMYLWDRSMLKEFTPWLEQKFPEIEITFVQAFIP